MPMHTTIFLLDQDEPLATTWQLQVCCYSGGQHQPAIVLAAMHGSQERQMLGAAVLVVS